jgi:hypothetical protein
MTMTTLGSGRSSTRGFLTTDPGAPFTVEDLAGFPVDGRRHELREGAYVEITRVAGDSVFESPVFESPGHVTVRVAPADLIQERPLGTRRL